MFTCSISDVTFGVTGDTTFATTQETEAVEETAQGLSEWTPDDVAQSSECESSSQGEYSIGGFTWESFGG